MVNLKINNIEFEAPDDYTILDVAQNAGLEIPTLCFKKGMPHYSSCMVCMVKDRRNNSYMPSCSALVQDGMDIDISGDDVISLRRKAIELLLSEHRAECEAPCRIVCPAGYNIPLFNRFTGENNYEAAIKLTEEETSSGEIMCGNCAAYCENACRRKKIDLPVSIRNLKLFIYSSIIKVNLVNDDSGEITKLVSSGAAAIKKRKQPGRFNSYTGKVDEGELKEWLKECTGGSGRFREIADETSASGESRNCMHCDCRASSDCRLRDVAEKYQIKDPRGKLVNSQIKKKINQHTGLVFENAKCIKCGLCVRLCEDLNEEHALCFINRGFISIISEPVTAKFDDILLSRSKDVIEICPTGALSRFKEERK